MSGQRDAQRPRAAAAFRRFLGAALSAVLVAGLMIVIGGASPATAATGTIVSLTFDDANADQFAAAQKLKSKGMAGTFFMNSGFLGAPNYLTAANVAAMKADGHEIASHTISHPDLTAISVDEATRQICNDRVNFAAMGIPVANFAYPFASSTTAVENAAENCGANSARGLGDVKTRFSCTNCVVGESVPPPEKYFTRAPDQVERTWTLADLKKSVTQAEAKNNGSWVQLTFHHICAGTTASCPEPWISPTVFNGFINWLATRTKTQVRTVGSVIGGTTRPAVAGPVAAEALPGVNAIKNPSMETFNAATGLPQCYLAGGYGANTASFAVTADAHTGSSATTVSVSNYADGDAKLVPLLDLGECAPTVTPGDTYTIGEWYKSTAVTQFAMYYRNSKGLWNYWTSSPWFAASSTYSKATYVTPALPADATALSFGLNLFNNGTLTTDDLSMMATGAAPSALHTVTTASFAGLFQPIAAPSAAVAPSAVAGAVPAKAVKKLLALGKRKGDKITKHHVVPGPSKPGLGAEQGKDPRRGIAPGQVVLPPFVVSPELTLG